MKAEERLARNLAAKLLSGPWTQNELRERLAESFGPTYLPAAQQAITRRLIARHQQPYPPSPGRLCKLLMQEPGFRELAQRFLTGGSRMRIELDAPHFSPAHPFQSLDIPRLTTTGALANWLEIPLDELLWLANSRRRSDINEDSEKNDPKRFEHYTYTFVPKPAGPPRLIEAPKPRTKSIQRRILSDILSRVPVHDCAHGFVTGRSCLSGAQVHAGEALVLTADLQDFFLNTPINRVHGLFRSLGYPLAVARLLTALCSSAVPAYVFKALCGGERYSWQQRNAFQSPHLAQGAPTSPALSNLVAYRLDVRLAGLARSYGARYTRYADDLAFSGDASFAGRWGSLLSVARNVISQEGYSINPRKTRVMADTGRQEVTGVIINQHLNIAREDYDKLKAILFNCVKHGPESQNRDEHSDFRAHLDGRITWVENVNWSRGQKLRAMFLKIRWPD
ncbi:MAG: reverse transcriptase family protein [Alphaproteobacteria bacterium]|nr:reverse transcriptase family protein [Alphaproteobacteria bacterium]